jgi:hypothetical protein
MTTYQIAVRSTAGLFERIDLGALYGKFLNWWASLYVDLPPRNYL